LCAHNDASLVHVALQCIPAVFLAVSTGLIAAPDRAWVILVMIIEPCHASLDLTGYPMGTVDVAAPYGCAQCKFAIVCDGYRFVLILEWRKRYNRSKNFFFEQAHGRRDISKYGWGNIETALQ